MAQFDVHRTRSGGLVLDCQCDLLRPYNSRVVAPLMPPDDSLPAIPRLNPRFQVNGEERVLMIEFLTAMPVNALGAPVASLIDHEYTIS